MLKACGGFGWHGRRCTTCKKLKTEIVTLFLNARIHLDKGLQKRILAGLAEVKAGCTTSLDDLRETRRKQK